MARKSRTPPPPRRVQAPRARTGDGGVDRRKIVVGAVIAALALAGVAGAVTVYALTGSDDGGGALAAAGCSVETFPAQDATHVEQLPEDFEYNSDPPSSGLHHPVPAPFDIYDEPVEQFRLLHNLEHGGVAIQYGDDIPEAQVAALVDWYRGSPNGIVVAPRPQLGDTIALTAWNAEEAAPGVEPEPGEGIVAKCPRFDEEAFDEFMDEYAFKGPERFPADALAPGQ